MFRDAPFTNMH